MAKLQRNCGNGTHLLGIVFIVWAMLFVTGCSISRETFSDSQPQLPLLVSAPGSPIAVPFAPGGVELGDVNNDELIDLVIRSSESPSIAVLLGKGDGQFHATPTSPIQTQEHGSEMALGDINGDKWLDVVVGNHDSYAVRLLLGDGSGYFYPAPESFVTMKAGQHPHTHGLALGDLNNDGSLDLVTGNTADGDVAVALGDGRGGFALAYDSPFAVAQGPYPLALGDLDGDGNLDITVTSTLNQNGQSGDSLTVLFGDGQGGFRRSQVPLRTPDPWFVAIGDVNGDRKLDLVSSHWESSEMTVLVGNGDGNFMEVPESPFDFGHSVWYIGIADMNGDGYLDVIAAADDSLRLMLGDGIGNFELAGGSPYPTEGGSWRLAIGDINGDGKSDVVTSNLSSKTVTVLLAQ